MDTEHHNLTTIDFRRTVNDEAADDVQRTKFAEPEAEKGETSLGSV